MYPIGRLGRAGRFRWEGWTPAGAVVDKEIDVVEGLTPGTGIESFTAMGSDLWAAEALQEAGSEVGPGED